MDRCMYCQSDLEQGTRVCRACGRAQPTSQPEAPAHPASGPLSRRCPRCGEPAQPADRFCMRCAAPLRMPCPTCGQEIPVWAVFCPHCAHPLTPKGEQPGDERSQEVSVIPLAQGGNLLAQPTGVPAAPAAPQSGMPSVPSAPAGPQSGAPPVPGAPGGSQSGAPTAPGGSAAPQTGVPPVQHVPASPQAGAPTHAASAASQSAGSGTSPSPASGTPAAHPAPGTPPGGPSPATGASAPPQPAPGASGGTPGGTLPQHLGHVGRGAGRAAGRGLPAKLLGTATGKIIAAVIVVTIVGTGAAATVIASRGSLPPATALQSPATTPGAADTPTPLPTHTPVPPTPTPTSVPPNCGSYVDIGDLQSESGHDLAGWSDAYDNQPPSPSGDTTFRYQPLGREATIKLCVPQVGIPYTLTTEVQDFGCDDSFAIFVNDGPSSIYTYQGTRANVVRVHTIPIPASDVVSYNLVLGFESVSTDCGLAAVYNVSVAPS